ncbi:MAG TPA: hydroxymethylbilane synthase [Amnibacterium sp.]
MTIRIGTRGSALALAQAGAVATAIEAQGEACELVVVRTEGDVSQASLAQIGGTGVFAGALRRSLAAGECDLVVHSLKDLPVLPVPGLVVAGIPVREDARDALCARDGLTLDTLPAGAVVGTGSPRRRAQLMERRPDLAVRDLRGNVDTRLAHVAEGRLDAVVLSLAGLTRLGRTAAVTEVLPLESWPTAAGQGALALEIRADDAASLDSAQQAPVAAAVRRLTDPVAMAAATAERAVLGRLEAGCVAPIGVASAVDEGGVALWASVHEPGGGRRLDRRIERPASAADRVAVLTAAANRLADELLDAGAGALAPLGGAA